MRLELLDFTNFRLIANASIPLAEGVNLFVGENAQGKTTILEGASYLATGRSFRTARDKECIGPARDVPPLAAVQGRHVSRSGRQIVRVAIQPDTKVVFIDGHPARRLGDLAGVLNVVRFVPSDLELVRGGPPVRRALMDSLLAQTSRPDLEAMQNYAVALKQRTALLRQVESPKSSEFDAYEEQMATYGADLLRARHRLMRRFATIAAEQMFHLAGGTDALSVGHVTGWPQSTSFPEDAFADSEAARMNLRSWMATHWRAQRAADIARVVTGHGPHRADISLTINDRDARTYASQGQSRCVALALRLAEAELLEELAGEPPVLLLDDVLGELDQRRAAFFFRLLSRRGVQALVTATNATQIEAQVPIAAQFRVSGGVCSR